MALEAWRKRGLDGTVTLRSPDVPAVMVADILCMELLVHAWDFARATGQTINVGEALSGYVLERGTLAHSARRCRDGDNFAAEIEVGPDADNLTRLAAFTGRKALT